MSFSRDIERYADLFAARTKVMKSSAMRDLMAVTARPEVISLADALTLRATQPEVYEARARAAMAAHVRAMLAFQQAGAVVFDYGNNLRAQAREAPP